METGKDHHVHHPETRQIGKIYQLKQDEVTTIPHAGASSRELKKLGRALCFCC